MWICMLIRLIPFVTAAQMIIESIDAGGAWYGSNKHMSFIYV